MIARHLIAAAYPIAHDEGCYLDPEFGQDNLEREYWIDEEDEDEELPKPFCNCGTDDLNKQAEEYLANASIDEATILAAIEMIKTIQPWGLTKSQLGPVELLRKHIIGNLLFMAGLPEEQ
jgi:hypothetical protein